VGEGISSAVPSKGGGDEAMRIERSDFFSDPRLSEVRPVGSDEGRVSTGRTARDRFPSASASSFDRLELSEAAKELFRQEEATEVFCTEPARTDRMEVLRQALREGSYRVSSRRVADAILAYLDASRVSEGGLLELWRSSKEDGEGLAGDIRSGGQRV